MNILVLETVTAQHKLAESRLFSTSESLIDRIIKKAVSSLKFLGRIAEAINDKFGFVALDASPVNAKERKTTKGKKISKSASGNLSKPER